MIAYPQQDKGVMYALSCSFFFDFCGAYARIGGFTAKEPFASARGGAREAAERTGGRLPGRNALRSDHTGEEKG